MQFLTENWHLILLGGLCILALLIDLLAKHKFTNDRKLSVVVALFATFGIAWVTQEYRRNEQSVGDVDYFLAQLATHSGPNNAFRSDILLDLHRELVNFKQKTLEASTESGVRYQVDRALRNANKSVTFMDNYLLLWEQAPDSRFQDERAAIRRGVVVRRIFILSDLLMRDKTQVARSKSIMDRQAKAGINVSYVLETDLQRDPTYSRYAYVDYVLVDDEILIKIGARVSPTAPPIFCQVYWDPLITKAEDPFNWLHELAVDKRFQASVN